MPSSRNVQISQEPASESYLEGLAARTLSHGGELAIAKSLSEEEPANDVEAAILAGAKHGIRFAGSSSLSLKYGKLKEAIESSLPEQASSYHRDFVAAACRFARLNRVEQLVFLTWAAPDDPFSVEKALRLPNDEIDLDWLQKLRGALWPEAPRREQAARVGELIKNTNDEVFHAILEGVTSVIRFQGLPLSSDKNRQALSMINACFRKGAALRPSLARDIIVAFADLSEEASRAIRDFAVPENGALFPADLEQETSMPEGLESLFFARPFDVVTGRPEVTKDGYFIVVSTAEELLRAMDFATSRQAEGKTGSLIVLGEDWLTEAHRARASDAFAQVIPCIADVNWYLEDPRIRRKFDEDNDGICAHVAEALKSVRLESRATTAYFSYNATYALFWSYAGALAIWRAIIAANTLPQQLIFMDFEKASNFVEKVTGGGRRRSRATDTPNGVLFLGAAPSAANGTNVQNMRKYKKFRNSRDNTAAVATKKQAPAKSVPPDLIVPDAHKSQCIAILFHPNDAQYCFAARAMAAVLPADQRVLLSSRPLTDLEAKRMGGITMTPLDSIADPLDGNVIEEAEEFYAQLTKHKSLDEFLLNENVRANGRNFSRLAENLVTFVRQREISHALFLPERPGIMKLALSAFETAGVFCVNVESSIFGDEPVLGNFLAHRHFVVDPYQKENLRRFHSVARNKISVAGPVHDFARGHMPKGRIPEEIFNARRRVLLCTQSDNLDKNLRLVEASISAFDASGFSALDGAEFVIRPHPSESEARRASYLSLAAAAGRSDVRLCEAKTFMGAVAEARFVISRFSTVLYDARNDFAAPIAVNLSEDPTSIDFIGSGVCLGAKTEAALTAHLDPARAAETLFAENAIREKLKSGIDDPVRQILRTIGVQVAHHRDAV